MAMDAPEAPTISSFVIRFVVDPGQDAYRGEIRHIQTREEIHFHAWEEAVEFIKRYVPIEKTVDSG
jgi:Mn-containing catalase